MLLSWLHYFSARHWSFLLQTWWHASVQALWLSFALWESSMPDSEADSCPSGLALSYFLPNSLQTGGIWSHVALAVSHYSLDWHALCHLSHFLWRNVSFGPSVPRVSHACRPPAACLPAMLLKFNDLTLLMSAEICPRHTIPFWKPLNSSNVFIWKRSHCGEYHVHLLRCKLAEGYEDENWLFAEVCTSNMWPIFFTDCPLWFHGIFNLTTTSVVLNIGILYFSEWHFDILLFRGLGLVSFLCLWKKSLSIYLV